MLPSPNHEWHTTYTSPPSPTCIDAFDFERRPVASRRLPLPQADLALVQRGPQQKPPIGRKAQVRHWRALPLVDHRAVAGRGVGIPESAQAIKGGGGQQRAVVHKVDRCHGVAVRWNGLGRGCCDATRSGFVAGCSGSLAGCNSFKSSVR